MIKSILFGLAIFFAGALFGIYFAKFDNYKVNTSSTAIIDQLNEAVYPHFYASGSWIGENTGVVVHRVLLECEPAQKSCTETTAEVREVGSYRWLDLKQATYRIESNGDKSLTALDASKDSCLHTRLMIDRIAKSVTKIRNNEASSECAKWEGYPKAWSMAAKHNSNEGTK